MRLPRSRQRRRARSSADWSCRRSHDGGTIISKHVLERWTSDDEKPVRRWRAVTRTRPAGLVDELNRTMTGSWHSIAVVHFNPLGVLWPYLVRPWTFTPRTRQTCRPKGTPAGLHAPWDVWGASTLFVTLPSTVRLGRAPLAVP